MPAKNSKQDSDTKNKQSKDVKDKEQTSVAGNKQTKMDEAHKQGKTMAENVERNKDTDQE